MVDHTWRRLGITILPMVIKKKNDRGAWKEQYVLDRQVV